MKPCVVIEFLRASRRSAPSLASQIISQPILGAIFEAIVISRMLRAKSGSQTVYARLWS